MKSAAKPITAEYLKRASLHYLNKYDTTEDGLRNVLKRRVAKRLLGTDEEADQYDHMIEEIIQGCVKAGYLNDDRYIQNIISRAQDKGLSKLRIIEKLGRKGISRDKVTQELAAFERANECEGDTYSEECAAMRYAEKKKIGKFRAENRDTYRDKDLARLARQGFSFEIARKVIDEKGDTW